MTNKKLLLKKFKELESYLSEKEYVMCYEALYGLYMYYDFEIYDVDIMYVNDKIRELWVVDDEGGKLFMVCRLYRKDNG